MRGRVPLALFPRSPSNSVFVCGPVWGKRQARPNSPCMRVAFSCTSPSWRGGRVVEGTPLLRAQTVKNCLEGSNPFLSAIQPKWLNELKLRFQSGVAPRFTITLAMRLQASLDRRNLTVELKSLRSSSLPISGAGVEPPASDTEAIAAASSGSRQLDRAFGITH